MIIANSTAWLKTRSSRVRSRVTLRLTTRTIPWVGGARRQRRQSCEGRGARWRPAQSRRRSTSKVLFAPAHVPVTHKIYRLIFLNLIDSHRFVLDGGRADTKVEFVLVLCNATIIICTIITVLVIIISTNKVIMIIIRILVFLQTEKVKLPVCIVLSRPGQNFRPEIVWRELKFSKIVSKNTVSKISFH